MLALGLGVVITYQILYTFSQPGAPKSALDVGINALLPLFFILLGVFAVRGFFISTRIEFYESFARVFSLRGGSRDLRYPQLEVEPQVTADSRGASKRYFRLWVKGEKRSWEVGQGKVLGADEELRYWLEKKTHSGDVAVAG